MDLERLTDLYRAHVGDLTRAYARVLAENGFDAVVLHAGSLKKRTDFDDQYWPLRATPHFQHWVPLAVPDCALIVAPHASPKARLAIPTETSFWETAPEPETRHYEGSFEILDVDDAAGVRAHLPKGRVAFIGEDRARAASWGIADGATNPTALVQALDLLRATKSAYEVLCLAEANRRAGVGHRAVADAFASGDASELDLHLAYLRATAQDDPETPYKNIVALGPHGATLHHVSYDKRATSAQSLLLDAGATYQGYCSDVTRTWTKGTGATASAFAAIVAGVEAMQQRLCDAAKVGLPYEELHEDAHRQIGVILREVGVVKASGGGEVARDVTRAFFPHGLGHSLGLQCHDVGCALRAPKKDNPFLRNTSTIVAGQVFTIEPGVYFIPPLLEGLRAGPHAGDVDWKAVDALAPFGGVRIEDDLVVTGPGTRNLTREVLPG